MENAIISAAAANLNPVEKGLYNIGVKESLHRQQIYHLLEYTNDQAKAAAAAGLETVRKHIHKFPVRRMKREEILEIITSDHSVAFGGRNISSHEARLAIEFNKTYNVGMVSDTLIFVWD